MASGATAGHCAALSPQVSGPPAQVHAGLGQYANASFLNFGCLLGPQLMDITRNYE